MRTTRRPPTGTPRTAGKICCRSRQGSPPAPDGGIPVFTQAYSGGAAEISQVIGAMNSLGKIAGTKKFLLVGDSKLISYNNVAAMGEGAGVPGPRLQALRQGRRAGRLRPGQGHRGRSLMLPDATSTRRTPAPSWAAGPTSWKTTSRRPQLQTQATRRSPCAASSCTPVPGPTPPSPTAPGSSPAPRRPGPPGVGPGAAGSTQTSRRSPTASSRSASPARSAPTCATASAPPRPRPRQHQHLPGGPPGGRAIPEATGAARRTPGRAPAAADPANPPSPGGSTRPPSTPKPPPTAGTPCSPTSTPPRPQLR